MIIMAISLVLFLPLTIAENITLSSPEKVNILENFSVTVDYNSGDILDIKIAIQDNESKVYSEIYNNGWKSSFYYLPEKYPYQHEYILRAKKEGRGELTLCARLRKGNKVLSDKVCKPIPILGVENIQNEDPLEPIIRSEQKIIEKDEDSSVKGDQGSLEEKEEEKEEIFLANQEFNKSEEALPLKIINLTSSKKEREKLSSSEGIYTSSREKLNYAMILIFQLSLLMILSFLIYKALRKI